MLDQVTQLGEREALAAWRSEVLPPNAPAGEVLREIEVAVDLLTVIARGAAIGLRLAFWPAWRTFDHAARSVTTSQGGGASHIVRLGSSGCLKPCRSR